MQKQKNKITTWQMRAAQTDKAHIAQLAKRLKVKQSEAVRQAVAYMLETTEVRRDPKPTGQTAMCMTGN